MIAPPPARVRDTKRGLLVAGIGAVLALGAILAVSLGGDDAPTQAAPAPTPATPPRPAPAPAPDKTEGADEVLRKAAELASSGRRDAAISALAAGRKAFPKDARIPYEAAKLYLDKMWWADGLEQARAAIALDATYRTDPALIKLVVRGFNTTKHVDSALARFLRDDIGATAKPYLEETAEGHPNPIVRKRAQAELIHYP